MVTEELPGMLAFDPDIILASDGFDGHESDLIGHHQLVEDDSVWATGEACVALRQVGEMREAGGSVHWDRLWRLELVERPRMEPSSAGLRSVDNFGLRTARAGEVFP